MAINLFDCGHPSMGGIKRLKLATRTPLEAPLQFPLDIVLKTNNESIIMLSDDEANRKITIGNQEIQYRIVYPFNAVLTEDEVNGRQGKFFQQKLDFELPQVSLTTTNQLKSFLFSTGGEFAISNMLCLIEDMNDVLWIIGYTQPLILENFDLETGVQEEDNKYILSYTCKSYSKVRQYEII